MYRDLLARGRVSARAEVCSSLVLVAGVRVLLRAGIGCCRILLYRLCNFRLLGLGIRDIYKCQEYIF